MRKMKESEEWRRPLTVVDQEVAKISTAELRRGLKRMKSGKTVGPDDTPVEVWRCPGEVAVEL